MWNDVNVSEPEDAGDYLVYQTPDHKNFHMAVVWYNPYSLHGGWGNNFYVYYWQPLPTEPQLTMRAVDASEELILFGNTRCADVVRKRSV